MTVPQLLPWRRADAPANARGQSGAAPLQLPLPAPARVAVLNANFREQPGAKCFRADDLEGLREYSPDVLVLPLHLALLFAERQRTATLGLPSLSVAIIVLTSLDGDLISGDDRDQFWAAFGLPVFEQLLGHDGAVIARECEVHDGLHVNPGLAELNGDELKINGVDTGLTAELEKCHCECGNETPRLQRLNRLNARVASAAA